ncbi:MAG: NAD(P)H-binding protein [Brevinematales bacterium]|jgi:NAD(P)H dehydrogenase (quinone)
MENNNGHVYALTGAGGHLGRLALSYILDLVPAGKILATTRRPELLSDFTAQGVTVRRADFSDTRSLEGAFSGATRILIISTNEYPMELRSAHHMDAIKAAVNAGVRHITSTYFSLSKASNADDDNPWTRGQEKIMDALARSGREWTVLNMNIWMDGIPYFLNALRTGEKILIPEGSGKPCWVSHEDYARTAVSVLTGKALINGAADVTGPESLGLDDLARRWAGFHERNMEVQIQPGGRVIEGLVSNGMPLQSAEQIVGYCDMFRLFDVKVSDTVRIATGKPPVSADELLRNLIIPE